MRCPMRISVSILAAVAVLFFFLPDGRCSGKKVKEDDQYYFQLGADLFKEGYYELIPRGQVAEGQKKIEQAVDALDVAVSINANNIDAHYLLARIYVILNKYPEAAAAYNRVIRLDPGNIDIYLYLASTYVQMKQYQKATDVLNHARTLTTDTQAIDRIASLIDTIREQE